MIQCHDIHFQYPRDSFALTLSNLEIPSGKHTAVIGASGCGKTTLLRLIAGILQPEKGEVTVNSQRLSELDEPTRQAFRIQNIGLVFQEFELLEYLTARENILLPFQVSSQLPKPTDSLDHCERLAKNAGIAELLDRYPEELSQGERQRVSICRALVTNPSIILADEPTGNLDPANQQKAVQLLKSEAEKSGATLVMVTHEHELLSHFEQVIDLSENN